MAKTPTPSTDLVVLGNNMPIPLGYEGKPEYVQWFAGVVTLSKFLPDFDVQAQINEQILTAESEDAVLGSSVSKKDEILDRPFLINDVKWQKSSYENSPQGLPAYVVLSLRMLDTLSEEILVVGSLNVMLQARRLLELNAIPQQTPTTLIERHTSNDFDVLRLTKFTKPLPSVSQARSA